MTAVFTFIVAGMLITGTKVYASKDKVVTSEGVLRVVMTRGDGINITPSDNETVCTGLPIKYEPDTSPVPELFKYKINENEKNKQVDSIIKHGIECQYSLSTDDGASFGEWNAMNANVFLLNPGSIADGEYRIRFRKLDYYYVDVPSEGSPAQDKKEATVSGNMGPCENGDGSTDSVTVSARDIKKAESIVKSEPCHAVESVSYRVLLDSVLPGVDLESDRDFDVWTSSDIKCRVIANDAGTRIKRLKITCADEVIKDETVDGGISCGSTAEFVLSKETAGEGEELVVEAVDGAGNVSTVSRKVKIDKTSPSVGITGVEDGGIYSSGTDLGISGEDLHPGSVVVGYTVIKTLGDKTETVAGSSGTFADLKDGVFYKAADDGDYCVEIRARDGAGNEAGPAKKFFRVDTTAPVTEYSGIPDGAVLRTDGELTVTVSDNFPDACRVSLSGSVNADGTGRDVKLSEFKMNGRSASNTYYFRNDGEYDITVMAEDKAGNINEEHISFSIDKTAPVIEIINGLKSMDEVVLNTPPTLGFRITESNYGTALVSCELKKTVDDTLKDCKVPEWVMDSAKSDFSITIDEEGSYELNVRAVDRAGNMAGKSLKFTLDTTKPEIDYVDNLNRKYIKSFRLPDNFNEYIKDSSKVDYRAYLNSMNYDEGSEISEDGKYVLKIIAVDDAGNQAEKTVEFIVDSTAPRVVIDGMNDEGNVNRDGVLTLSLYDEEDYFTSVKVNGKEVVTGEKQKSVEVKIGEYGDYTIDIEAADMADNVLTQRIDAKCANTSPVEKGVSTVRTLKKSEARGKNKGLKILLIVLTVLVIAGSVVVYCIYCLGLDPEKKRVSIKAQSIV